MEDIEGISVGHRRNYDLWQTDLSINPLLIEWMELEL